jgi:hypothetical protein
MKTSSALTIHRSTIDDAPLFYDVIEQTMRDFIIATWGRWNEDRVRQESLEDSVSPHVRVVQVGGIGVGVSIVERLPTHIHQKLGISIQRNLLILVLLPLLPLNISSSPETKL